MVETPRIVEVQQLIVTGAYTLEIFMPVATIYPDIPDLHPVAFSGDYNVLENKPVFGSAAYEDVDYFATYAQGQLADIAWNHLTPVYDFGGVIKADGQGLLSGTAISINMSGEPIKRLTLDHNATITLTNLTPGQDVLVRITQGSTGGTAAWANVSKWDGGAAPVLGVGAGIVDDILLSVEPNGSTVLGKQVASFY